MITEALLHLFERDLDRLEKEVLAFTDEKDLWRTTGSVTNSAGNLCMHICGNLRHFIGATLGGSGYVRDREREFAAREVPRTALIEEIANTRLAVNGTLIHLSGPDLIAPFPIAVFETEMSTASFLIHLQGHLNYHLGQINYLRRIGFPG